MGRVRRDDVDVLGGAGEAVEEVGVDVEMEDVEPDFILSPENSIVSNIM